MSSVSKEPSRLRSALGKKRRPRVVELATDFWTIRSAIQQEVLEWAAVDGQTATQEALGRTVDAHWRKAVGLLDIGDEERRAEVVDELLGTHLDYCCLTLTIDRGPMFEKIRTPLLSIRKKLEAIERMFERREADYSDRIGRVVSNFIRVHHPRSAANQGAKQRRIGENVAKEIIELMEQSEIRNAPVIGGGRILSRQFDLKARQCVRLTRRRLDRLLGPVETFVTSNRKGKPNKYSKQFLILRCARIFEVFDEAGRKAKVSQISEAKRQRLGNLAHAYPTGFVPFVGEVLKAIDPEQLGSAHSLGKTIRKTLKVRIAHPSADEFVTNASSLVDLLNFMKICEGQEVRMAPPVPQRSSGWRRS
jgi:hypothetical protein